MAGLASILNPLLTAGLVLNFLGVALILYGKLVVMRRPSGGSRVLGARLTGWGTASLFLGFVLQAASLLL